MTARPDWARLFRIACAMIERVNAEQRIIDHWSLGGGTALMLQIDHRESHDVDFFLHDAQLLAFLDPQKSDFDFDLRPIDYTGDGARFLKLGFDIGEIDFIVAAALTSTPTGRTSVEGKRILLDTIPEIIAKKIYYRGATIAPRDIFDIAAASEGHADSIISELRNYRDEVAKALAAIKKQNPDFVSKAISQLQIRDRYDAVAKRALETAQALLSAVS